MTTNEFNANLTKLVQRAIRNGVNKSLVTLPQLVGVLRAHASKIEDLNVEVRSKQIADSIVDKNGASPAN